MNGTLDGLWMLTEREGRLYPNQLAHRRKANNSESPFRQPARVDG
jgi:hypothetical protein